MIHNIYICNVYIPKYLNSKYRRSEALRYPYKHLNQKYTRPSNNSCRNPNFQIETHAVFGIYTQETIQSGTNIHHYMFRANVEFDYNRCHYPRKMSFTRYQRPN